ncbi:M50 family metallopeptidase [Pseudobacillus badius]|uniref:M50 family metallopeptidase n=1 Tax=Bacillus badius TaxID=1455 RepID=UPI001CBC0B12|nr:M50 family metallopeptidase [Bacillus badius]UAT29701.1 M50 family metallopeptidase [Bacillus badius]GLY10111.1 stage IV sporulation protein FB [Bacillus badius]
MNKWMKNVHIHPLLWGVIGVCLLTGTFLPLLLAFTVIVVHESGHALAAHALGWRVKKVVLLPFGGVAEVDEHGNRPLREELLVVLAGPLQHLWLFAAAWLAHEGGFLSSGLYESFWDINMAILLFNLLPVYPLDGGKLLMLLFSAARPFLSAFRLVILCSACLLFCLQMTVFFFFPFHLQAWALFFYLGWTLWRAWKEKRYAFMRFLLERHYGNKGAAGFLKPLTAPSEEPVMNVLERFQRNAKHIVYVTEGGEKQGRLDENELLYAYFSEKKTDSRLKDLLPVD